MFGNKVTRSRKIIAQTPGLPDDRAGRPGWAAPIGTAWLLTDGKPGMENQCLGLAEALGLDPVVKRIRIRPPRRWLAPYGPAAGGLFGAGLAPPWPDLLIASGRQSVPFSIAIRRRSAGRTITVQIQNPRRSFDLFDLVVAPRHDGLEGANVVATLGALHRVTPRRLAAHAARFAGTVERIPRPRVAVLIGGGNGAFRLSSRGIDRIAADLRTLALRTGSGLAVTVSRRTSKKNGTRLRSRLAPLLAEGRAVLWTGDGENPYFAYLAAADHILVTADSVSMISEAAATGKPVHILGLDGGSAKFRAFHDGFRAAGIARPFTGGLEDWTYTPPDDIAVAAAAIKERFVLRANERLRAANQQNAPWLPITAS